MCRVILAIICILYVLLHTNGICSLKFFMN